MFVVLINVWRRGELCQISFNNNQSEMGLRGLRGGPRSMKFFGGILRRSTSILSPMCSIVGNIFYLFS